MTGFDVNAKVSWGSDPFEPLDAALVDSPYMGEPVTYVGDSFEEADLDSTLAAFSGDPPMGAFAGLGDAISSVATTVVKPAAYAVKTVSKPVAIVAGIGAAGSAVVFPPAAPVLGAVAAQAVVAGTIAAKIDSAIATGKPKPPPRLARDRSGTMSWMQKADPGAGMRAAAAAAGRADKARIAQHRAEQSAKAVAAGKAHLAMQQRQRMLALREQGRAAPSSPAGRAAAAAARQAKARAEREKALILVRGTQAAAFSSPDPEVRAGAMRALRGIQAALNARRTQHPVAFVLTSKGLVLQVK